MYKLRKVFYGLKQASCIWYSIIDSFFLSSGFTRSENGPTLYLKHQGNKDFLLVCLYVDYMICIGSSKSLIDYHFKSCMMRIFVMTNLGLLQYFLGLEMKQGEDGSFVCQKKYVVDLLKRFNMRNCEEAPTPMNKKEKL